MFEKVKHYYDTGLWSIDRVWNVVGKAITQEEYHEITGFEYPEKSAQMAEIEQNQGLLSWLLTTAKTSIVAAINELFNSKANKVQEGWQTPTLLNGWVEFSVETPVRFRKNQWGSVAIKGGVKSGTSAVPIFTLPVGYRPENFIRINVRISGGGNATLDIYTNGNVIVTSASSTFVSLDNIIFGAV